MKNLKQTSNYLKSNARKNLALAVLGAVGTFIIIFSSIPSLPTYIDVGTYQAARGTISLLPFIIGILFWRKYNKYKLGFQGEKCVTETLMSNLSDEYYLINDVTMPPYNRGNIDHIVLSPNGIFAIETKNHRGKITCYGDEWLIRYSGKNKGSTEREFNYTLGNPSSQIRNNAYRIKKVIDTLEPLKTKKVWVQGIVVFSNKFAELRKEEPPECVDVLTLNELLNYLKNYTYLEKQYTPAELNLIGKEILRAHANSKN